MTWIYNEKIISNNNQEITTILCKIQNSIHTYFCYRDNLLVVYLKFLNYILRVYDKIYLSNKTYLAENILNLEKYYFINEFAMIRNGRTPTILLVALVLIILILCYNNWGLSQRNISLRESLMAKEEKLNDMMEKKAFVEKQIGINSDRIKYFEERIEANKQIAQQKDSDIDDLNSKLKTKITENDKLTLELNDAKEALVLNLTCFKIY